MGLRNRPNLGEANVGAAMTGASRNGAWACMRPTTIDDINVIYRSEVQCVLQALSLTFEMEGWTMKTLSEERAARYEELVAKLGHRPWEDHYKDCNNLLVVKGAIDGDLIGYFCNPCFVPVKPGQPREREDMFANVRCPKCEELFKLDRPDYAELLNIIGVGDNSGL